MAENFLTRFLDREPTLIINTEMTDKGRLLPIPTPKSPVYYSGMSLGFTEFGNPIAGETPPEEKKMLKLITKILLQQGYKPATKEHPATQYIVVSWGTYRQISGPRLSANGALLAFLGGHKLDLMWEAERFSFINPSVLRRGMRDGMSSLIMDMAAGDMYLLALKSFDMAALEQGKIEQYWETRIGCPAEGLDIAETLPTMMTAAGPMIGRETTKPVWLDDVSNRKTSVEIGEEQVIEFIESDRSK